MIITSVNNNGLQQIHNFLGLYHKLGANHFTPEMLQAWATDAEFQLGEGNTASIEIRSWDSVTGRTETYTITDSGLNFEEIAE
jgi:hypothetical protein